MTLQEAINSGKLFKLPRHTSWLEVFRNEFVNTDTGLRVELLPSAVIDNGWITKDKPPRLFPLGPNVVQLKTKRYP